MQKPLPAKDGYVCLGVVMGAHGIKGEVKLKSFTAQPTDIGSYGTLSDEEERSFVLKNVRIGAKGSVLAVVEGITDRNVAEALRGTALFAPREALPPPSEEELLYADLPGFTAQDSTGAPIGTIVNIFNNGAHDIIEIKPSSGKLILIPFVEEYIEVIDVEEKIIALTPQAADLLTL